MPLLDIHHVSRTYGSVKALTDVTLVLEPGTIGLVGNNGAGKSTLLKVLLGLLTPDSGNGTILDCDIRLQSRELRGRVGYMPEAAAVVPMLKGVEFVTLSGDLYGMPHRDARRRAHEVLNYVGLGELRYRRLEEYSTGNLQRLKLAAALIHDPQLLLLDEPTNGLDPAGRASMLRLIEDLITETGKSVILCTHLLSDVEQLCDQIVVLHRGTVIRSGPMASLRAHSANRFELGWQGEHRPMVEALTAAGLQVEAKEDAKTAFVTAPADWSTREFFAIAHSVGAQLVRMRPDEEDLQQLFFRVTDEAASVQSAAS
jgi:ABC-2 type transport system ATP-binding protein